MVTRPKPRLIELSERDSELQPGRLDTAVTYESGAVDTLLTRTSRDLMLGALAINPEEDWLALHDVSEDEHEKALICRRLDEIKLIRIALGQVVGEVDGSNDLKEQEFKLYSHYSEKLYFVAIKRKIKQLEDLLLPSYVIGANEIKASVIDDLYKLIPTSELEDSFDSEPTQQTITSLYEWLSSQFEDVFDYIDSFDTDELDAASIKNVFDLCINTTPDLRDMGWSCEIVEREKNAVSVYASEKKIVIPTQRKASAPVVKKLVIHEVFGHALRSALADKDGSVVGAIGTATYQSFEESFEITLEQCLDGTYNPMRCVDHYLAIGMALTSNKSREDIMMMFNNISQLNVIVSSKEPIDEKGVTKAKNTALTQIRRTFAGQTDIDQGIPHLKDIDYLHGTSGSWALLNEIVRLGIVDSAMKWLLSAKFNPFDAGDRLMIEQLHPMPTELTDFFKVIDIKG